MVGFKSKQGNIIFPKQASNRAVSEFDLATLEEVVTIGLLNITVGLVILRGEINVTSLSATERTMIDELGRYGTFIREVILSNVRGEISTFTVEWNEDERKVLSIDLVKPTTKHHDF